MGLKKNLHGIEEKSPRDWRKIPKGWNDYSIRIQQHTEPRRGEMIKDIIGG